MIMMIGDRYLAVDLTHVFSMSESVISATLGHNSMDQYLPQIQVLFLFSLDHDSQVHLSMSSILNFTDKGYFGFAGRGKDAKMEKSLK